MPTVFRTRNGWRVVIYPNDHRPPHVHVVDGDRSARFELLCALGEVALMSTIGFSQSEVSRVATELQAKIGLLCNAWEEVRGD